MSASMRRHWFSTNSTYAPLFMLVRTLKRQTIGVHVEKKRNEVNVNDDELFYEDYLEEELDRDLRNGKKGKHKT